MYSSTLRVGSVLRKQARGIGCGGGNGRAVVACDTLRAIYERTATWQVTSGADAVRTEVFL